MANHILIGIGGTGYKVLREFRKRFWAEVPNAKERKNSPVRFLYIDSDANTTPDSLAGNDDLRVNGQDTAITPDEYLGIKNIDLNSVFDNLSNYPNLKPIIGNGAFIRNCIGEVGAAAGQKRRAGRILFAANAHEYNKKITHIIGELQKTTGSARDLNIYIFAGLAGGTGSGSIVDAIAQVLIHHPDAKIEVFAMVPERIIPQGLDAGRYHANGYAALCELSALNAGTYLPADVSTGKEHITLSHPDRGNQFGLTVYTNVNRNGATVDSFTTLPSLIADLLYFRIFNIENEEMKQLDRHFKNENRPDYIVEYKTSTKPGKPLERARTKAVGSFGIKRVRYPDQKLKAHSSEAIARNIVSMMNYLNYDNDLGFINEVPKQSKDYGEYINRANLRNWKLSDADLSLSIPILTPVNGRALPTFEDFWAKEIALDYDYATAKEIGQPLQILEQYFEERYRDDFREERGVEAYFQAKANEQVISDCATAIVSSIQRSLFNNWLQGQYSAYDVKQVTIQILNQLQAKVKGLDEEIVKLEDEIEKIIESRRDLSDEYAKTGILKNLIYRSKENLFQEYSQMLSDEYVARTRLASIRFFQKILLPTLIDQFIGLQTEVQKFVGRMEDGVNEYGVLIGQNTPSSEPDLKSNIVEVGNITLLDKFEKRMLRDKMKMETMAQNFRNHIAQDAGYSFDNLSKKMANRNLAEIAGVVLDELIGAYHAEFMRQEPVLGLNVMEQLYQMYGNNDDETRKFASTLIQNSEVFINLNDQEVNKNMRNTESPTSTAAAGPQTIMLVAIPNVDTDNEDLKRFYDNFRIKLEQSFNATENRILLFYESPRPDELTIVTYQNLFPIRAIDYVPFLREKIEKLINTKDDTQNITNRILLFSEGDGTNLPSLHGEGEGPVGDELIKYLFWAVSLGIIKIGEDDLGNKGWGSISVDTFGAETFTLLSSKFTGLLVSPQLTSDATESLVEQIDAEISKPRHIQEKTKMAEIIKSCVKDYVLPESGSPTTETYKRFSNQALKALEKLQ